MSNGTFRGIFTIPSTPFNDDGTVDVDGFKRIIEFCIACGATGLVYPVNASEYTALSDDERKDMSRILVEQTSGRIPTVIGVAATSRENASRFARYAHDIGADAVIAMPPYVKPKEFTIENTVIYYRTISETAKIPVIIQNYVPPVGTNLSPDTLLSLCRENEYVEYVKEETVPSTLKITELNGKNKGECKGVFGGSGCRYLIEEYRRGSVGNMPGCHVTDVCVALWNALESGDNDKAMRIYCDMAPLFFFESQFSFVYKEVLKLRGIIKSSYTRNNTYALDEIGMKYLQECVSLLKPYMTV